VRIRIDWKYALNLELSHPGFDFSVLCEFRARVLAGHAEQLLFETMLDQFKTHGLLKARGHQRTDSTHILVLTQLCCIEKWYNICTSFPSVKDFTLFDIHNSLFWVLSTWERS